MNSNAIEVATKLAILNNMGATVADAQDMRLINDALFAHLPTYLSEIQQELSSTVESVNFYNYLKVEKLNENLTNFFDDVTVIKIHNGSDKIISVETEGNSLKTEVIMPDLSFFEMKIDPQPTAVEDFKPSSNKGYNTLADITETEVCLYTGNRLQLSALVMPRVKLMELFRIRDSFMTQFHAESQAVYNASRSNLMGLGFEMNESLESMKNKVDEFLEVKNSLLHGYGTWESEVEHFLNKVDSMVVEYRKKLKNLE